MAVQRQPSVRPVGLLVDTVPFEIVETVKRPSSCPANCTRAGASSSSPVTLPTFVDNVLFEPLESAKRPSSCLASFTRAGASSNSPGRLPSARQADIQQDEHNPGWETSSEHYRDGTLSSSLSIPTSDRLLRPSIDCETAPGRRNERSLIICCPARALGYTDFIDDLDTQLLHNRPSLVVFDRRNPR